MENNENEKVLKKLKKKPDAEEIAKMKEVITKEAAIDSDIVKDNKKDAN